MFVLFVIGSCNSANNENTIVYSPSKNIEVSFQLLTDGTPTYLVKFDENNIIDTSKLGFDFKELLPIKDNFKIVAKF